MSNTQAKRLKRKRRAEAKRKYAVDEGSLFYDGEKYRTERYMPLMYAIESWLCTADAALRLRGDGQLDDRLIGLCYRDLILSARANELRTVPDESGFGLDYSAPERLREGIIRHLSNIVATAAKLRGYGSAEVIGVLRTLNASRVTWNEIDGPSERAYIEFLLRTIGVKRHLVEAFAGIAEDETPQIEGTT